jgi:hypothetical protein
LRHRSLIVPSRRAALRIAVSLTILLALLAARPTTLVPSVASADTSPSTTASAATTPTSPDSIAPSSTASAIAVDPTSPWAKTAKETAIWSGWDTKAVEFAKVAASIPVQIIETNGTRSHVWFPGDSKGHKAGDVWIETADLTVLPWPRWARARQATSLRSNPDVASDEVSPLARGNYVEIGETQGRWAKAFFLTDSAAGQWAMGWVDALDLMLPTRGDQADMSSYLLTRTSLLSTTPDVWLNVPYRSQLDGSAYADANCGPTSVAMALDALGKRETLDSLRASALKLQDLGRCDDCGTYIQHLAKVAESRGASTYGLRDTPDTFHSWTMDDIREQLRQQRVVIPQVQFNKLPGRLKSPYGGDHYIVIVGIEGTSFIYNDPVDSDGRGYGRLITADQLGIAMAGAHGEFARAAFAVGK